MNSVRFAFVNWNLALHFDEFEKKIARVIGGDVVSVSSRSRLFTSRAQDVILDQIMQATLTK